MSFDCGALGATLQDQKDRGQGNRSKVAVGTWRDHLEPPGESGCKPLGRSLDRRELQVLPGHEERDRLCSPTCLGSEAATVSYESYDHEQFS